MQALTKTHATDGRIEISNPSEYILVIQEILTRYITILQDQQQDLTKKALVEFIGVESKVNGIGTKTIRVSSENFGDFTIIDLFGKDGIICEGNVENLRLFLEKFLGKDKNRFLSEIVSIDFHGRTVRITHEPQNGAVLTEDLSDYIV